jgi:hypothetical protein
MSGDFRVVMQSEHINSDQTSPNKKHEEKLPHEASGTNIFECLAGELTFLLSVERSRMRINRRRLYVPIIVTRVTNEKTNSKIN